MVSVKVRKVGNSLGFTVPKELMSDLHLVEGDELVLTKTRDGFQLSRLDADQREDLEIAHKLMTRHRAVLDKLAQ